MSANLAVRPVNRYRRRAAVFSFFIILDGRAAGGGQRGHVASDINDDDFEEVMVHEIGRSHSGGHIAYDKHVHEGKKGLAKLANLFFCRWCSSALLVFFFRCQFTQHQEPLHP